MDKKLLQASETGNTVYYVRANQSRVEVAFQIDALVQAYGTPSKIYRDLDSGLNENRQDLNKLLKDITQGQISRVCITQKDSLTRFGYKYLAMLLKANNVELVVLREKGKPLQDELLEDLMSMVASFSGNFYRLRGYKQQKRLLSTLQETLESNQEQN